MDIIDYIVWMFTAGTGPAYVSLLITVLLLLASLKQCFDGYKRGIGRQILHAAFAAVTIFISYFITEVLIAQIHVLFTNNTPESVLVAVEGLIPQLQLDEGIRQTIINTDTHMLELLVTLPAATLLAPIVFYILYLVLSLVMKLFFSIFSIMIPKAYDTAPKIAGMFFGLFEGIIVTSLVCLPIVAAGDMVGGVVDKISEDDKNDFTVAVIDIHDTWIEPICHNPYFEISRHFGADDLVTDFATVDLGEGDVDMREELYSAVKVVSNAARLGEINWESLSEDNKALLTSLVESIDESDFFSEIIAALLNGLSAANDAGITIPGTEENPLLAELFDDMYLIFSTSDRNNVGADLATIKDTFFVLSDGGVLTAYAEGVSADEMLELLSATDAEGKSVIEKLYDTLYANKHTTPLLTTITELSLSLIKDSLDLDTESEDLYNNVRVSVNDILSIKRSDYASYAEYEAAVEESLAFSLNELNGLELDEESIARMASHAASTFSESEELSEADINSILLRYFVSVAE